MDTFFQEVLLPIIGFSILGGFCLFWAIFGRTGTGERAGLFLLGLLSFGLVMYSCFCAGQGYAADEAGHLSKWLTNGHAYTTIGMRKDGKDLMLAIRADKENSDGTHKFYLLRTREPIPPEHFHMNNGKPEEFIKGSPQ